MKEDLSVVKMYLNCSQIQIDFMSTVNTSYNGKVIKKMQGH